MQGIPDTGPVLLLVRHAESAGNADGIMQGQGEYPLTAAGHAAARTARNGLTLLGLEVVASSDLRRAVQTAEHLGAGGTLLLDPRWRERDAGPWTGMAREEMEAVIGRPLDSGWRPDGFENLDVVVARMLDAIDELLDRDARGAVVTHGASMRAVEKHLGGTGAKFANLSGFAVSPGLRVSERVSLLPA